MFFFQPSWLQHGSDGQSRQPIFSVDIQANGNRLATAGQDSRVRLWSCDALTQAGSLNAAVKNESAGGTKELLVNTQTSNTSSADADSSGKKKIPKGALLATLMYHAGAVNCVRFSPDGTLLASGGDDSVVLTYERLPGAGRSAAFGSGEEEVENWRCRKPLRGHDGDVTDLAWSSDSDRFCSASIDNTVFVWSARTEKALVKLEGHIGFVKGVAWDPIGKYIASQSDDKSVIIWRTSDWSIEKKITSPFSEALLEENNLAFFLRLNWSPCGTMLAATNAYAKKTATHLAPMFSRESGLTEHIDFVGHTEPVTVARFSARLYCDKQLDDKAKEPSKDSPVYTCLALGSKDRGASLWRAGSAKPFINLEEMFSSDVVDLAWGADGYMLVACSTDGSIMLIRFDPGELGYTVPKKIEGAVIKKLWQNFGGRGSDNALPESKVQVDLEEKEARNRKKQLEPKVTPEKVSAKRDGTSAVPSADGKLTNGTSEANAKEPGGGHDNVKGGGQAKVETERASKKAPESTEKLAGSGEKRKAEDLLSPAGAVKEPKSTVFAGSVNAAKAEESRSDDVAVVTPRPKAAADSRPKGVDDSRHNGSETTQRKVEVAQREERLKGGRRRIIPQSIDAVGVNDGDSQIGNAFFSGTNQSAPSLPSHATEDVPPAKRPRSQGPNELAGMITAQDAVGEMKTWVPSLYGRSVLPSAGRKGGSRCRAMDSEPSPTMLEATPQGSSRTTMISCSREGSELWRDYIGTVPADQAVCAAPKSSSTCPPSISTCTCLGAPVVALAGISGKFAAVATADAFLFIYSARSGRRLAPPISLDATPHIMDMFRIKDKSILLVVTRSALVNLYSLDELELLCSVNAAPLLVRISEPDDDDEAPADDHQEQRRLKRGISVGTVTEQLQPVLILSDGHGFTYSKKLESWLRIADDHAPNSEFYRLVPAPNDDSFLSKLQVGAAVTARKKGSALLPTGGLKRSAVESLAHLETLMAASVALGDADQYKHYLACYALRLASTEAVVEGTEKRLREVCEYLSASDDVLGVSKRELLRSTVLPALSKSRRHQRLVEEFTVILDELGNTDEPMEQVS